MLRVRHLSKTYTLGTQTTNVLCDVSFHIEEGEFCSLTGASGSGKTTLMNIIGTLDRPSSGHIEIAGRTVGEFSDDEAAYFRNHTIGFVFQAFHLLSELDALNNVALPLIYSGIERSERLDRAKSLLGLVGLSDRSHHKPDELSGGQKQRVAIARALVNDPSFLLADEPTGNLDSQTAGEIMNLFQDLNENFNTTILIVTHDKEIANSCSSQIRLKDGRIIS